MLFPLRPEDLIAVLTFYPTCADPGIFVRGGGGPGQSDKKSSGNVSFFFLVLSLFYSSKMVHFKEIYHFSRFQRGSNIFQGGPTFSKGGGGGVQLLIPYRNPFQGEGSGPPVPPSGSALAPSLSFFVL